jgi:RND superfamily putative drug exporter
MLLVRLARSCYRYRWLVVGAWLLVVVAGAVAAPSLFGRLTAQVGVIDGSESGQAGRDLYEAAPSGAQVYALVDGRPATDPGLRDSVTEVARQVRAVDGVEAVADPWSTGDTRLVADDGTALVLAVQFAPYEATDAALDEVVALLRTVEAPEVVVGGGALQDREMDDQAAEDLEKAELLSLPLVLVLLLVLFGGVVAAGLPVVVALVGVAGTLATLYAVSLLLDVSVYAVNIVTMLGLGLAVDYALLLVARFREERAVDPGRPRAPGADARDGGADGRVLRLTGRRVPGRAAGVLGRLPALHGRGGPGRRAARPARGADACCRPCSRWWAGASARRAAQPTAAGVFVRVSRFATRRPAGPHRRRGTCCCCARRRSSGVAFAKPGRPLAADRLGVAASWPTRAGAVRRRRGRRARHGRAGRRRRGGRARAVRGVGRGARRR